ncbi:MAG: esterase/lipase superfamily enzyme [Saprospiraceae bacterium]
MHYQRLKSNKSEPNYLLIMTYKKEYIKWHSPILGKEMEMLKFGHAGRPVVIFPTTMGRYWEVSDLGLVDSAKWFLEQGLVQIYCPDSINDMSWYNKEMHPKTRVYNHTKYDQMLVEEVVDSIRHKTGYDKLVMAGPSFGGYQAANFAFRHPERVSHLFSMSGSFNIKSFLDGYYDSNVYFNNPVDYVPSLDNPELHNMKIILGTSEWDILKEDNEQMSGILKAKGIDHWLDMRGWIKHDWPLWNEMFPHYLSLL